MASDLQTPFDKACVPDPSGSPSGGVDLSGGYDFPDGRKETANMSGLPLQPTIYNPGAGDPGMSQVDMPPVASPGTIPTDEPKYGKG